MALDASTRADVLPAALLVGESWREAGSGGDLDHVNPATGKPQRSVPLAGATEVDEAVTAAKTAFRTWRRWRPTDRKRVLQRLAELMRHDGEKFRVIAALESGLPRVPGASMADMGADWIEHAAGWADRLDGDVLSMDPEGVFDYTLPEPVGVVAVILTWNGPIASLGMCVAPALAAGCTVLVKPSELAPFSAVKFGALALEAGIPPGVVNVLPGGPEAGEALVRHPGIAKISFTGGGETAKRIAAGCAETLKPAIFELGGKSANIVFDDADLPAAARSVMGLPRLAGQTCTLASRHLVHRDCYDEYLERITELLAGVRVGDPLDPETRMGPVISQAACDRVLQMIGEAPREGADLRLGGNRLGGELADGYFIEPTIFTGVAPQSRLAREEVFGPVLAVTPFDHEEEAVEIANDSAYGLAGYLHTRDLARAHRVAAALEVGSVGVNGGTVPAEANAPFGGVKQSGYGRIGGLAGVAEFLHTKNVQVRMA